MIPSFGLPHGEKKPVFKHQMMVSSSSLLTNGDKIGLPYLYVITEITGMRPNTRVTQLPSCKVDKPVLGLVLMFLKIKM